MLNQSSVNEDSNILPLDDGLPSEKTRLTLTSRKSMTPSRVKFTDLRYSTSSNDQSGSKVSDNSTRESESASNDDVFYSPGKSPSIVGQDSDKERCKTPENVEIVQDTKQNEMNELQKIFTDYSKHRMVYQSPQSRRTYKRSLDESPVPVRSSPRRKPSTQASLNVSQEPVPLILGRRSLTRTVLEHNTFSKVRETSYSEKSVLDQSVHSNSFKLYLNSSPDSDRDVPYVAPEPLSSSLLEIIEKYKNYDSENTINSESIISLGQDDNNLPGNEAIDPNCDADNSKHGDVTTSADIGTANGSTFAEGNKIPKHIDQDHSNMDIQASVNDSTQEPSKPGKGIEQSAIHRQSVKELDSDEDQIDKDHLLNVIYDDLSSASEDLRDMSQKSEESNGASKYTSQSTHELPAVKENDDSPGLSEELCHTSSFDEGFRADVIEIDSSDEEIKQDTVESLSSTSSEISHSPDLPKQSNFSEDSCSQVSNGADGSSSSENSSTVEQYAGHADNSFDSQTTEEAMEINMRKSVELHKDGSFDSEKTEKISSRDSEETNDESSSDSSVDDNQCAETPTDSAEKTSAGEPEADKQLVTEVTLRDEYDEEVWEKKEKIAVIIPTVATKKDDNCDIPVLESDEMGAENVSESIRSTPNILLTPNENQQESEIQEKLSGQCSEIDEDKRQESKSLQCTIIYNEPVSSPSTNSTNENHQESKIQEKLSDQCSVIDENKRQESTSLQCTIIYNEPVSSPSINSTNENQQEPTKELSDITPNENQRELTSEEELSDKSSPNLDKVTPPLLIRTVKKTYSKVEKEERESNKTPVLKPVKRTYLRRKNLTSSLVAYGIDSELQSTTEEQRESQQSVDDKSAANGKTASSTEHSTLSNSDETVKSIRVTRKMSTHLESIEASFITPSKSAQKILQAEQTSTPDCELGESITEEQRESQESVDDKSAANGKTASSTEHSTLSNSDETIKSIRITRKMSAHLESIEASSSTPSKSAQKILKVEQTSTSGTPKRRGRPPKSTSSSQVNSADYSATEKGKMTEETAGQTVKNEEIMTRKRLRSASVDEQAPSPLAIRTYSRKTRSKSVDEPAKKTTSEAFQSQKKSLKTSLEPINEVPNSKIPQKKTQSELGTYTTARRLTRTQIKMLKSISEVKSEAAELPSVEEMDPINLLDKQPFQGNPDPDEIKLYEGSSLSSSPSISASQRSRRRSTSVASDVHSIKPLSVSSRASKTTGIKSRLRSASVEVDSDTSESLSPPKKSKTIDVLPAEEITPPKKSISKSRSATAGRPSSRSNLSTVSYQSNVSARSTRSTKITSKAKNLPKIREEK